MTQSYAETYELYLDAWGPMSRDERTDLLRRSLAKTAVFINPQQVRRGIQDIEVHLEDFQVRTPRGRRRHFRWRWAYHRHPAVRQRGSTQARMAEARCCRAGAHPVVG